MNHKLHLLRSALVFLFLVGILFAALALLPVMAQRPQPVPAAPADGPASGEVSMLAPSRTGYVVDNSAVAPYFRRSTTPDWTLVSASGGYNNDYLYAEADDDGDWAEWRPDLQTGWYEVYVYYYAHPNRRTDVEYKVYHASGVAKHLINQQLLADGTPGTGDSGWVGLGLYRMLAGSSYVRLSDVTTPGGTPTPGYVIADAVKFAPVDVWVDDDYYDWGANDGKLWGVNAFDRIQDGLAAVASSGTVWVKPGTYVGPITITKAITLTSTGGPASTIITVTNASNAAVQVLASNAKVWGFGIQSNGADYGVVNRDWPSGWVTNLTGYSVANNWVHGFTHGIRFRRAAGEIRSNTVYSNTDNGIWADDYPTGLSEGPTTISRNTLYGNGAGGGAADYDIRVEDSFTGTTVISNAITGSGAAGEAGIFVYNAAGTLDLTANTVTGCNEGVLILQDGGTGIVQKVNFQRNAITGGATGVRVRRTAGSAAVRQIIIGGSVAEANRIYANSGYELLLTGYSANITATSNYWGVCNLRDIEDEIYHEYDAPALGLVTYEPAICVPRYITVEVKPATLPADGTSTAVVTATATDFAHQPVVTGTMIGLTTTLGSVPYGYAEAEGGEVVRTGVWGIGPDAHASAGQYAGSSDPSATIRWSFTGTAVSLIYLRSQPGALADVYVDDMMTPIKTISMHTSIAAGEWQIEDVIANSLSASGAHTIEVRINPASAPGSAMWVDAFRSGGTVAQRGRITTLLTSAPISGTAIVVGTVYNGRIITGSMSASLNSVITDSAEAVFLGTDVSVYKVVTPDYTSPGKTVTYTIYYSNTGVITATGTIITDTLPADFVYLSYSSRPSLPSPIQAPPVYRWTVGDLGPGATGRITITARIDPAASWPSTPDVRTNVVEITTWVTDTFVGGNLDGADVTVVPNPAAHITVTAYPTWMYADGAATTVVTAEVRDMYHHLVLDGTIVTFTTSLAGTFFPSSGSATGYGTTTGGFATIVLQAGTLAGTTRVTATVGTVRNWAPVELYALAPCKVFISARDAAIRVSNGDISTTLYITVTDQNDNLVRTAPVTLTTDAGTLVADSRRDTTLVVTTTNGTATAKLASGPTVTTATVTAEITATSCVSWTASTQVAFIAGEPVTITSEAYPTQIRICDGPEGMSMITVTVTDGFGNLVEDGTPVDFQVVPGVRGEVRPASTGTASGVATATLISKGFLFPAGARQSSLEVYISAGRGQRRITWSQPITLTPGLPSNVLFTISPSPMSVNADARVEARVVDCAGNAVDDGTVVTFEATSLLGTILPVTTTTNNGLALATFRSGCVADVATITATIGLSPFATQLVIEPGVADRISVDIAPTSILNCGGRAVVTAVVRDVCNNLVKDNTQVLFAQRYGYVSLSRYVAYTHDGVVTTTATADQEKRIPPSDWPTGFEQINATSGTAMSGWTYLTIEPGLARDVTVAAAPAAIPINGDVNGYDITVVAAVVDCSDTPVADCTVVRLETSKGVFRESGQWFVDRLSFGGAVTGTLTSQSKAGTVIITATANSAVGNAEVYFEPGEPWRIEVDFYPGVICADGASTTQVMARVYDEYDNPVGAGVTVTFVTDYGHFLGSNEIYTTTTELEGFALATLVSDIVPRTALVRAITTNYRQGYSFVHFVACKRIYLPNVHRMYR